MAGAGWKASNTHDRIQVIDYISVLFVEKNIKGFMIVISDLIN